MRYEADACLSHTLTNITAVVGNAAYKNICLFIPFSVLVITLTRNVKQSAKGRHIVMRLYSVPLIQALNYLAFEPFRTLICYFASVKSIMQSYASRAIRASFNSVSNCFIRSFRDVASASNQPSASTSFDGFRFISVIDSLSSRPKVRRQ